MTDTNTAGAPINADENIKSSIAYRSGAASVDAAIFVAKILAAVLMASIVVLVLKWVIPSISEITVGDFLARMLKLPIESLIGVAAAVFFGCWLSVRR